VQRPAVYYDVTGSDNLFEAVQNIRACSQRQPSLGSYQASTSYAANWSYTPIGIGGDVCQLASVKVIMYTSQLLPRYSATTQNPELQEKLSGLYAHENEHTLLSFRYAEDLYVKLVNLRTPCDNINARAAGLTTDMAGGIKAAHRHLDDRSHHGTI
jgi:predicted secreted Zn-dependent protease